jgi:hypothetical protein
MSRLPDVFENNKIYTDTFRASYLEADPRKIILAYKALLMLNGPMKKLNETAPKKISYVISKARNLVAALLIQGVLNDDQLPQTLDGYGKTLQKDLRYKTYLNKIATTQLLQLLKIVFAEKNYAEKIEAEKYSFLRNKELFQRCMEVGGKKYGWVKKYI